MLTLLNRFILGLVFQSDQYMAIAAAEAVAMMVAANLDMAPSSQVPLIISPSLKALP